MPNPISAPGVYDFNFNPTNYYNPNACAMSFCGATVPTWEYGSLGSRVTAGFLNPAPYDNSLSVTACELGLQGIQRQDIDYGPYCVDQTSPSIWNQ